MAVRIRLKRLQIPEHPETADLSKKSVSMILQRNPLF